MNRYQWFVSIFTDVSSLLPNVWFVSDYGSDDNDCQTESTPCKNLQTVLDRASDDADIHVSSHRLTLNATHCQTRYPWSAGDRCCQVKSSISFNISTVNDSSFELSCSRESIFEAVF